MDDAVFGFTFLSKINYFVLESIKFLKKFSWVQGSRVQASRAQASRVQTTIIQVSNIQSPSVQASRAQTSSYTSRGQLFRYASVNYNHGHNSLSFFITKLSFYQKWNKAFLLVINMIYIWVPSQVTERLKT